MAFMLQIQNYMSGIARLLNNSTFKAPLKTFFLLYFVSRIIDV